jgi:methyl-accepting chemotaxis protein
MKLTIGRKLGIVTGITLAFMLIAIAANVAGLNTVRASTRRSVEQLRAAEAYKDLVASQSRSYSALFEYVADGEADDLQVYQAARQQSEELTEPALAYCNGCHPSRASDIQTILEALQSQQASSGRLMDEALTAYQTNPADAAAIAAKVQAAEGVVASQLSVANQVQTSHGAFIDEQLALDERQAATLLGVNMGLGLVAIIASGWLAVRISGGIVRSITSLRNAADGMSRGELDTPIELHTGDEMEDMAGSIERMRASLKAAMDRLRRGSPAS